MNIFELLRDNPKERIDYGLTVQSLQDEMGYLRAEVTEAQEDMLRISDAFDNIGYKPLGEQDSKEMTLRTVKRNSETCRGILAVNPFVKRGVDARVAYIWGKGVLFDGVGSIDKQMDRHRRKLFTPQAFEELERVLATDGNAFTAVPIDSENPDLEVYRIGIDRVVGSISNPRDPEDIWFYRIETAVTKVNGETGQETTNNYERYYYSMPYYKRVRDSGKNLRKSWNKVAVDQEYVIQHTSVNKQVGWRWGVPDVMPVMFWAKAYKEYLEDNADLVKAYSRIAMNITASNAAGAQAVGAQVMNIPGRDPITGERAGIGGTTITPVGTSVTAMPATGSTVDFSKGSALAAAIASGLGVSLVVIISDSGASNRAAESSLDLPTLKSMESRQQVHTERFLEIFEFWGAPVAGYSSMDEETEVQEAKAPSKADGPQYAIVTWPQINSDTTKDRVNALGTGVELGILFKQEARREALDLFGIAPYKPWDDLPTMEDDPASQEKFDQEVEKAEKEAENASVIAKQGVAGGISAKGGGMTDSNDARANRNENQGKN